MGSEGYLITQFLAARTNQRTRRLGRPAREPHALRRRDRAPHARRRRAGLHHRLPHLDARPGRGRPRAEEIAEPGARRRGGGRRRSSTPASAGTRRASRPSRRRCRAAPSPGRRGGSSAAVRIPVVASNRINAPEIAEEILARGDADMVSMARALLADPEFAAKAQAGDRAGNQHLHRLQPGLPRPLLHRRAGELRGQSARRPRNAARAHRRRRPRRSASPWSAAAPPASSAPRPPPSAATRSRCSSARPSSAASSTSPSACPASRNSPSRSRYYAERLSRAGVERAAQPGRRATTTCAAFDEVVIATGIDPRRPEIAGIGHPKVVSYVDVLTGRVELGQRRGDHRHGRHRLRRRAVPRSSERAARRSSRRAFEAHWGIRGRDGSRRARRAERHDRPAAHHDAQALDDAVRPHAWAHHRLGAPRRAGAQRRAAC